MWMKPIISVFWRFSRSIIFAICFAVATQHIHQLVAHQFFDVGAGGLQILAGVKLLGVLCTRNEKGELVPPPLRFDILNEVVKRLPGFPIVLHGSSSVPQEYVQMVNANGGKMPDAVGIPEEQLREAARSAVCKIKRCE